MNRPSVLLISCASLVFASASVAQRAGDDARLARLKTEAIETVDSSS